jgi:hypothetical protein
VASAVLVVVVSVDLFGLDSAVLVVEQMIVLLALNTL